jgi:betaine-aldehyde dehydrogenase
VQQGIEEDKRSFLETPWKYYRTWRFQVLLDLANAYERNTNKLIAMLSLENGKIKHRASFEVTEITSKLRYYVALKRALYVRSAESELGKILIVSRQAVNVACIIMP